MFFFFFLIETYSQSALLDFKGLRWNPGPPEINGQD